MATWNAFYIRYGGPGDDAQARASTALHRLRNHFAGTLTVRALPDVPIVEVQCSGLDEQLDLMRRLSAEPMAEVVGCFIQTSSSTLSLRRFKTGNQSRFLQYSDAAWLTAEGEPEPWEAEELFSAARLEAALEAASDEASAQRTRALFAARRIATGEYEPSPDPWSCLQRSLGLSKEAWERLRKLRPAFVVQGAQVNLGRRLAIAIELVGASLCVGSGAMQLPNVGALGFVVAWLGLALLLRRSSWVVAVGGGLIGACIVLPIGLGLGSLVRLLR